MIAVKGIYDGKVARPIEDVSMPENVSVIITFLGERENLDASTKAGVSWSEFIRATYGCMAECPIERGEQGRFEERDSLS